WQPGRLTCDSLDEATAPAAGHRPCGECRHADLVRFRALGSEVFPQDRTTADVDRRLRTARLVAPGVHRSYEAAGRAPRRDVRRARRRLLARPRWPAPEWGFDGYRVAGPRPALPAIVRIRTLEPTVAVLPAGFTPGLHPVPPRPG
ncbi:MAG: hypothetical protein ACRYG2_34580, partial [Janthinobacterium lividum]